jgi:transposase-like protein
LSNYIFGLSHSSLSREFIEESARILEEFQRRDLRNYEFVALIIDGKYLAKEQMMITIGITIKGAKIPLDFIQ